MTRGHFKTGALIVVILSAAKNLGFRGGQILRFAQDDRFEMPSRLMKSVMLSSQLVDWTRKSLPVWQRSRAFRAGLGGTLCEETTLTMTQRIPS